MQFISASTSSLLLSRYMNRRQWFLAATFVILLSSCVLANELNPSAHMARFKMYSRGENGATDDKIPSCSSKNIELCTNKKLYMYLYSKTIAGLIILDDLLNLLLYQPEYFCNVKEQQTFNCLLDYCQRLISRKFQDNFLYFGLHQTQNFRHQVGDWVSLVRYKEPQIVHLGTHI